MSDLRASLLGRDYGIQGDGGYDEVFHAALVKDSKQEMKTITRTERSDSDDDEQKAPNLPRLDTFSVTVDSALQYGVEAFYEALAQHRDRGLFQESKPKCEIRFKNLTYKEMVSFSADEKRTAWTALRNLLLFPFRRTTMREKVILNKVSGVLRPGTMTLILGPPGCGKTSFLKALAGRLPWNKLEGEIYLNGTNVKSMRLQNLVDFITQSDDHLPLITVRETLEFAESCCRRRREYASSAVPKLEKLWPDVVMKALGIYHVADTIVGNELIRGVSGGQRKRVTIGEMMVGPKPIFLCDEISTGLDSATTFDIVRNLQAASRVFGCTFVCSLLQPSPEVVNLFDDILLLTKGEIAYHGPREKAVPYFEAMGFEVPFQKDRADFLQEITGPTGQQYLKEGVADYPRRGEEFVTRWKSSQLFKEQVEAFKKPWEHKLSDDELLSLSEEFVNGMWKSTKNVAIRQMKLTVRAREYIRKRITSNIFIGLLTGWLCYDIAPDNWRLRYSVFFFAATFLALGNIPVMPTLLQERPVYYKQRDANFFPTSSYVFSITICSLPLAAIEVLLFSSISYFMTGMAGYWENFFIFVLTMFLLSLSLASLFRFLAIIMPDLTSAQPVVGGAIILQTLFAGFIITQDKINPAWIWSYWLTPLSWALRCLALNEFHSPAYTKEIGDIYLDSMAIFKEDYWLTYGFIYMVCFWVVGILAQAMGLYFVRYGGGKSSVSSDEEFDPFKEEFRLDLEKALSSMPFNPVTLAFVDVCYAVNVPKEKARLELLRNVSGYAKPGRMLALMGESGAGKTTLMDVLAGRKTGGYITGDILFNGRKLTPNEVSRTIGYVEQMDIHSPTSTVREALQFSATLRLDDTIPQATKMEFVEQVLHLLELTPLADTLIGSAATGLTLEQRKRVTVGVELVANPSIIFLDEPTSGLDSRAAQVVMRVLKRIADTGRSVVCTIHQPSAEIFSWFDDLLLLVRGGKVAYLGPLGEKSCQLIEYFQQFPGTTKLEAGKNPADWMLELAGAAPEGDDYGQRYLKNPIKVQNDAEVKLAAQQPPDIKEVQFDSLWAAPLRVQLRECLKKAFRHYWRSPNYSYVRLMFMITIAVLYGTVFYQLSYQDISGLQSRIALIYSTTIFSGVVSLQSVIPVLSAERAVYYRERASNTYAVLPYSFALTFAELPYLVVTSTIFVVIMYYLVGLKDDFDSLFFYVLVFTLFTIFQVFFGQFLAVMMPTTQVAALTGSALITIWNLFCGFLIPKNDIPTFWIWVYWLSPTRYVIEALEASQLYCDYMNPANHCPMVAINQTVSIPVWKYANDAYSFDYDFRWWDVIIIGAFIIVVRVGKFLGLKYVSHLKR